LFLFFVLRRAFLYFICTISGCDGGNQTCNIAVYTCCLSLLSHDRHKENYPGMQGDALRRVLVERCLRPANKERVCYRSTVGQVWEYLDQAYIPQDTFLHDLMKPVNTFKELGEKNYQGLEKYLDLLLRKFDIAEDSGMLPIVLHQNNLRPMYEK
jgi:hypothetical protein